MLTSSFPNGPGDETCGYIRDFARSLADEFAVEVLAPRDQQSVAWPVDSFTLARSRSIVPGRFDPLQATADFNRLHAGGVAAKMGAAISLASYWKAALRRAHSADVVVSHWMMPCGLVGASLQRLLGRPHLMIEHSGALHLLAGMRGGSNLARFIVNGSARVVTVSRDLQRKLIALCPAAETKSDVIPMGICLDAEAKAAPCRDKRTKTILFIGRLTEVKGVDVLLRAMRAVADAQVVIAGAGPQRAKLEALAQRLKVNARFLGQVEAARRDQLFAACDAVVISSRVLAGGRTEGMPVVCLEAMAAGRAVIASRTGGLAELIVDGHNGLLVEPDDPVRLAERIGLVLRDAGCRQSLEQNARRTALEYSWARVGARYSELIKDCLRNDVITTNQYLGAGRAAC